MNLDIQAETFASSATPWRGWGMAAVINLNENRLWECQNMCQKSMQLCLRDLGPSRQKIYEQCTDRVVLGPESPHLATPSSVLPSEGHNDFSARRSESLPVLEFRHPCGDYRLFLLICNTDRGTFLYWEDEVAGTLHYAELPVGAYTGPRLAAWISSNFAVATYTGRHLRRRAPDPERRRTPAALPGDGLLPAGRIAQQAPVHQSSFGAQRPHRLRAAFCKRPTGTPTHSRTCVTAGSSK